MPRAANKLFLLTRLLRGVTFLERKMPMQTQISTHTPLARRDQQVLSSRLHGREFLLTRLLRGVTKQNSICAETPRFLLTRLLRGVTRSPRKSL